MAWCRFARSSNDDDVDDAGVDWDDDKGLWEGADLHIYIYVLYFVSSVLPKIQGVFLTGAPLKVLSVRLHLCTIVNPIKKVLSVRIYLPKKNFFRGAPVKKTPCINVV